MAVTVRAQFDYIVLKPISFFLTCNAIVCFFRGDWRMGLFYLLMLFAVGLVGATLYKDSSFRELAAGTPKLEEMTPPNPVEFTWKDSRTVVLSSFRVSLIVGLIASVLAHHQHGWVYSVLFGIGTLWLGCFLFAIFFVLVSKQYMAGRLHSLIPGLFLFWLGIIVVVVPITYVFRVLRG